MQLTLGANTKTAREGVPARNASQLLLHHQLSTDQNLISNDFSAFHLESVSQNADQLSNIFYRQDSLFPIAEMRRFIGAAEDQPYGGLHNLLLTAFAFFQTFRLLLNPFNLL